MSNLSDDVHSTDQPSRIAVVINRAAGSAHGIRKSDVSAMLGGVGSSLRLVAHGSQVVATAKRAIADGARTVVAAGGDGTVNAVASALVGTDVGLGVLPLGTLNHFARALDLPLDHQRATRIILADHQKGPASDDRPRLCDVGPRPRRRCTECAPHEARTPAR